MTKRRKKYQAGVRLHICIPKKADKKTLKLLNSMYSASGEVWEVLVKYANGELVEKSSADLGNIQSVLGLLTQLPQYTQVQNNLASVSEGIETIVQNKNGDTDNNISNSNLTNIKGKNKKIDKEENDEIIFDQDTKIRINENKEDMQSDKSKKKTALNLNVGYKSKFKNKGLADLDKIGGKNNSIFGSKNNKKE